MITQDDVQTAGRPA